MNDYVATYQLEQGLHRLLIKAKSRNSALTRAIRVAPVGGVLTNIRQKTSLHRRLVFPSLGALAANDEQH